MKSNSLRARLIAAHTDSPYYERAERDDWLSVFWGEDSVFRRMFETLDLRRVIDLGCGHGRHTAQIIDRAGHVTLVDANRRCIEVCRKRFDGCENVSFVLNSGFDLVAIPSGSVTSVFSYDAMVHFEPMDVIGYINELSRVLTTGGRALLHYSNAEDNVRSYGDNPEWRNFFSEKMMHAFAFRAELAVIESMTMPWGATSDALTLLELSKR